MRGRGRGDRRPGAGRRRRRRRAAARPCSSPGSPRTPAPTACCCMPPYLVRAAQDGPGAVRTRQVAAATDLPVDRLPARQRPLDPGHRGRARPLPDGSSASRTACGDLDLMQRIVSAVRAARPAPGLPVLQRPAHRRDDRPRLPRHRRRRSTPPRSSASRRRSPWPSTGRSPRATRPWSARSSTTSTGPLVELRDQVPGYAVVPGQGRGDGCAAWTSAGSGRRCSTPRRSMWPGWRN